MAIRYAMGEGLTAGTLVLVVGPSGAGKDSVLNGARTALAGDDRFVFVRRTITRPAGAGGEDSIEATPEAFAAMREAGGFSLHWRAHELEYGIPNTIESDLASGRCVVANVSRTVIEAAQAAYDPLRVVNVTAPVAVLAARIARRGREDGDAIRRRLERAALDGPTGDHVVTLENTRTLQESVDRFVALLQAYAAGSPSAVST